MTDTNTTTAAAATISFEMGTIAPQGRCFDHHGTIPAEAGFVAKMASVQLIEWLLAGGRSISEFKIELNHVGHLDDMVMHAVEPAQAAGKIRSLYAFAAQVSCLDSLGPVGYKFLQTPVKEVVDAVYNLFQERIGEAAEEAGCDRWKLPLDTKIPASKAAGELLSSLLEEDNYKEPEAWVPAEEDCNGISLEGDVIVVEMAKGSFNPLRASSWLFSQFHEASILLAYLHGENGTVYSACVRSVYHADLSELWEQLNSAEEAEGQWGGHSGAGGSPRNDTGSTIAPSQVLALIQAL